LKRKLIGTVAVDSGQLLIIDPCYISSEWKEGEEVKAIDFWGEGEEDVVHVLKQRGYHIERVSGVYRVNDIDFDKVSNEIYELSAQIKKKVMVNPYTGSTYDKICDLTIGEEEAGQLNFESGEEGLGVAVGTGADGYYNVYAIYQEIEGLGEILTKIEIELFNENDD
jgi:hypothetical protein